MFDLDAIDRMYEAVKAHPNPVRWCIFDKRMLLPLAQLPDAVKGETGEAIDADGLRGKAADGWFPLLKGAGFDGNEEGAPLYVPSRVGTFLRLERDGYGADELRLIADLEEWAIDNVYAADDLAYVDDDLDALILHAESRVEALSGDGWMSPELGDRAKELEKARSEVRFLQRLKEKGVPDELRPVIDKHAFRTRALNDMMRVWMLNMDRGKTEAGYSPYVSCSSQSWSTTEGSKYGDIHWPMTVRAALAYAEDGRIGDEPLIRVPGFVLRGEQVTPTRMLRPAAYAAQWKQHDIDKYLAVWGQIRGERRCLNCSVMLPSGNERKRFCGDKCRNAARQRRFRERNPEAVERAQKKYWDSIKLEET
jgi:hypothetical protein